MTRYGNRYDFKAQGQRFVTWLLLLLLAVLIVYFFSHLLYTPLDHLPDGKELVNISPKGQVTILDKLGLDWFIGAGQVKEIMEAARKSNDRIYELQLMAAKLLKDIGNQGRVKEMHKRGKETYWQKLQAI